jgi:hypothetical protein
MSIRRLVPAVAVALGFAGAAKAQVPIRTSVAFFSETYNFDAGLPYKRVNEYSVPIGITVPFGRYGDLTLSTGYAHIVLRSADRALFQDQRLSGVVDTELRASWNAIPGRLVTFVTAALPTGIETVEGEELQILGALASDVIGFTAPTVGSGGSIGAGFGGAVPLTASWSVGVGGTFRKPLSYVPVLGNPRELQPGAEFRARVGVEGPLARKTYVRVAAVFAHRARDALADTTVNGVGNRIIGYVSLSQGIGNASLILYGYDVFRGSPQIEQTAFGAAVLQRGNLIGGGARVDIPVTPRLTVVPRGEFRLATEGRPASQFKLLKVGQSLRGGVAARYQVTRQFAVVLQGSGTTGFVVQDFEHIDFRGVRGSVHAEWRP